LGTELANMMSTAVRISQYECCHQQTAPSVLIDPRTIAPSDLGVSMTSADRSTARQCPRCKRLRTTAEQQQQLVRMFLTCMRVCLHICVHRTLRTSAVWGNVYHTQHTKHTAKAITLSSTAFRCAFVRRRALVDPQLPTQLIWRRLP
jgi:hypothetical protein